jgi:hypothetical protein
LDADGKRRRSVVPRLLLGTGTLISKIIAFQLIIGDVAPCGAGVVTILPVSIEERCYLLPLYRINLVKQTDDAEKGLNYIADLLVRFRLVAKKLRRILKGFFIIFCDFCLYRSLRDGCESFILTLLFF